MIRIQLLKYHHNNAIANLKAIQQRNYVISTKKEEYPPIYDHTYMEGEINNECKIDKFEPTWRTDSLPACDLRGLSMHLSTIKIGKKINLITEINFALVKWPAEKPGLLFGIVPVEIFNHPLEIYRDPKTKIIPNIRPQWGTYQHVQVTWQSDPIYCLLITEGPMDRLTVIARIVFKRFYLYGPQIFDRESVHCLFIRLKNYGRSVKRQIESNEKCIENANKRIKYK